MEEGEQDVIRTYPVVAELPCLSRGKAENLVGLTGNVPHCRKLRGVATRLPVGVGKGPPDDLPVVPKLKAARPKVRTRKVPFGWPGAA